MNGYAFVRIVLVFILGVVLAIHYPLPAQVFKAVIGFLVLSGVTWVWFLRRGLWAKQSKVSWIMLIFLFVMGYVRTGVQDERISSVHIANLSPDSTAFYTGIVASEAIEKEQSWQFLIEVSGVRYAGKWKSATGRINVYNKKEEKTAPFAFGDELLIAGFPDQVQGPRNPNEFDYKNFLARQNIYYQDYITHNDVRWIGHHTGNHLLVLANQLRSHLLGVVNKYVEGADQQAVTKALVLGMKSELDNDLIGAYSAAGAMHVLAVSGLHVGIIFLVIQLILKPFANTRRGKWAIALFSILILWTYAFVTGLSPSVLRAVTMFSFMALATPWSRNTNIYNTLALSAFCLLLYNPYLILSVGFQLSYLAVLSIIYFFPLLYKCWVPSNRFVDSIWKATCVSLVAQLGTFGLSLFYFHQFPTYFMLSNLLVVPLAFVILGLGLILFTTSSFSVIATGVGYLIHVATSLLNEVVTLTEQLPFSVFTDIHISAIQCWLILLLILSVVVFIERRSKESFFPMVVLSLGLTTSLWFSMITRERIKQLTIYSVRGHHAMDLISGGQAYFFADSSLLSDSGRINYHIRPNRIGCGVQKVKLGELENFSHVRKESRIVRWNDLTIVSLSSSPDPNVIFPPIDVLIVENNCVRNLDELTSIEFNKLIIGGTYSNYLVSGLNREAQEQGIPVHAISLQGSFVLNLP